MIAWTMRMDGGRGVAAGARTRVLVVVGREATRQQIGRAVKAEGHAPDLAATVSEALEFLQRARLGYVAAVIEYALPDGAGTDLAPALLSDDARCCSLVIAGALNGSDIVALRRMGIDRTLPWPSATARLRSSLRLTVADTIRYRAAITRSSAEREPDPLRRSHQVSDQLRQLLRESGATAREAEIAPMIARGATDHEVAARVGRSMSAVRKRLRRLRERIGAPSRATLASLLRELDTTAEDRRGE